MCGGGGEEAADASSIGCPRKRRGQEMSQALPNCQTAARPRSSQDTCLLGTSVSCLGTFETPCPLGYPQEQGVRRREIL